MFSGMIFTYVLVLPACDRINAKRASRDEFLQHVIDESEKVHDVLEQHRKSLKRCIEARKLISYSDAKTAQPSGINFTHYIEKKKTWHEPRCLIIVWHSEHLPRGPGFLFSLDAFFTCDKIALYNCLGSTSGRVVIQLNHLKCVFVISTTYIFGIRNHKTSLLECIS